MLATFAQFETSVREIVFNNAPPEMLFTFGISTPEDASGNQAGDLFKQDENFLLVETEILRVRRAGPSYFAPRRAWASISLGLLSKSTHNDIALLDQLENVASWFSDKTVGGVRYRQFEPLGNSPLMGFRAHDGIIHCDFELQAMKR